MPIGYNKDPTLPIILVSLSVFSRFKVARQPPVTASATPIGKLLYRIDKKINAISKPAITLSKSLSFI